ncbi:MAG: hypothetical protein SGJ17_09875 [Hyphomicrobiales bacterium]|nr:hypothetical protein [Hyphomicrobiales bacterium]
MRRLLKFLHTIGSIGMMGAMASLLVLIYILPEPMAVADYARMRLAMAAISNWIFFPSLVATLVAGLLSMAVTRVYQDAGWVLIKLATGVLVFEGGLIGIHGPMGREAALSAEALSTGVANAKLGASIGSEWITLWVMMAVSVANVALGVWRPRFRRK